MNMNEIAEKWAIEMVQGNISKKDGIAKAIAEATAQLQKENEELVADNKTLELVAERCAEIATSIQSQLSTSRESTLREALAIVKNQRAGMDSNGLCFAQERIESLITTPASECEWREDENGPWSTGCGGMFEITDGTPEQNKMKFCPYCGKTIKLAEVKGVK